MKVIITRQNSPSECVTFELEKGLRDSEAFEVLRVFTVSGFDALADDFVLSWPKGDITITDAVDLKKVLNNFSGAATLELVIEEPESEDESYEFVTSGAVESATEEEVSSADDTEEAQASVEDEPVIEDYKDENQEEEEEGKVEETQAEGTVPPQQPSLRTRALQLVAEIGAEGMQNLVAITHSLLKEGAQLGDAIRTAIETSDIASSSPLVKDMLPLLDVYAAQYQSWVQMFAAFDVSNMIALIPSIVESVTRSMEGQERVELDLRPLMAQMCPQMLKKMEAIIPNGQERCWNVASPARPFDVFEQARADLETESGANLQVHTGITCDMCDVSPIVGVRYKSVSRPDFDLCEDCEPKHDPNDPLIKIKQPVQQLEFFPGFREFRRQCGGRNHGPRWGRRGGCRRGGRGRGRGRCGGPRHFMKKMMEQHCGQKSEMPCHKMKKMMKEWSEKCKANGKPTPCEMMKAKMKKMGCVNEDGSPNPCMFMKKMMHKMSQGCQNEDGSYNPQQFMQNMFAHHQEMMGFPQPSAPEAEAPPTSVNVTAPQVRGDPTLASFKAEKKEKKQELRSKKEQIRALKKEAHQCRKELKAMKKKEKLCAKVVGHLDMEEHSEQVAGSCCLKTWKVKNTGSTTWPEDTFITFTKGHVKLVADGYHAVPVTETVKPGEVTYIHAMFNVPNVEEGRFSVVYRLCDPNGKKFGAHLRTVINVVPAKQEVEEEEEEVRASVSSLNTAITYEEELLAEVDAEPSAPAIVPEAPEEEPAFQYEESLNTLTAMGFSDVEMLKGMLIANAGDVQATVALLF